MYLREHHGRDYIVTPFDQSTLVLYMYRTVMGSSIYHIVMVDTGRALSSLLLDSGQAASHNPLNLN